MNVARGAALGALALAVLLVAFILLRGDGGTEYKLRFRSAGGLVKNNNVHIGGRRAGTIRKIELTDDNQAEITVKVDDEFTPLHEGTTATGRALSLSGIANRYIALNPGPNDAKELPDGATITSEKTTSLVDLDQLFNTLDEPTRKGLQDVIRGSATQYTGTTLDGKPASQEFNRSARYFGPFLSSTDQLVRQLTQDEPALNRFVVDTSRVMSTLGSRRDQLSALVGNTNRTVRALGSENASLTRTLDRLPTTLRKGNTTFVNLRATIDDLDALVVASRPGARRLEPFLRQLRPLVRDAAPTIRDLRRLIREPGDANDTIDLLRRQPKLTRQARSVFPDTVRALRGSQEIVEFQRPYGPELYGFLRDFGQSAAPYDANGHFARVAPFFNAFDFTPSSTGGVLTQVPPQSRRYDNPDLQTGLEQRCPGAATQPRPDGSNPFLDQGRLETGRGEDCDPTAIPPGP